MISCGEKQKLHLQPQSNGKAVSMNKQPINAQENADYTAARGLSYASGWFKVVRIFEPITERGDGKPMQS